MAFRFGYSGRVRAIMHDISLISPHFEGLSRQDALEVVSENPTGVHSAVAL